MRLLGKRAIITGAGGGIGREISVSFSKEGADLICADINEDRLSETVLAVENHGGKVIPVLGDLADEKHSEELAKITKSELDGLTTVVSCAIKDVAYLPVTSLPVNDWRASIDVNLTGIFLLLKHTVPIMSDCGGGSIVLLSSQLAVTPKPGRAWYASQKGALLSLVKALAVDHAQENIRANTISPGPTADERFFSQWPTKEDAQKNASTLFNRLGNPEEMAAGALFLASDEASFITGTDLLIDGGYTTT